MKSEQALRIAEREYELYDQHRKQLDSEIDTLVNEVKRLKEGKKE